MAFITQVCLKQKKNNIWMEEFITINIANLTTFMLGVATFQTPLVTLFLID